MNTLGEKLKAARIKRNLSQNEVAEKLLVSRQTISKWENNVCLPDLDNFQK
ncbi:helix-turn-helix transcriptional regulator, partial [Blautia sp.]